MRHSVAVLLIIKEDCGPQIKRYWMVRLDARASDKSDARLLCKPNSSGLLPLVAPISIDGDGLVRNYYIGRFTAVAFSRRTLP
jgi:hypothetical protein